MQKQQYNQYKQTEFLADSFLKFFPKDLALELGRTLTMIAC